MLVVRRMISNNHMRSSSYTRKSESLHRPYSGIRVWRDRKNDPEPETPKTAIAAELTDIIGMAIVNAPLLGIDLEEAFARKWFDKLDRSGAAMDSIIDLPVVNRK